MTELLQVHVAYVLRNPFSYPPTWYLQEEGGMLIWTDGDGNSFWSEKAARDYGVSLGLNVCKR